jgi:predicted amidohydrolase YtcJ
MSRRADLVVVGRIATLAGADGPAWAEAIAVRDGRVVAAGTASDVDAAAGPGTQRLRLAPDEIAVPGLTDAHLHLTDAALDRTRVALEGTRSIGELVARVAAYAAANPPGRDGSDGDWIEGGGWDPDALGRWPTAGDLERAAPGRRVALWAHDHHALLASPRALDEAGVADGRTDPAGGVIRRDADGHATGVLHEAAASLVRLRVPAPTAASIAGALDPIADDLLGLGVVAVHDPGSLGPPAGLDAALDAYRSLAASGLLRLRVHASLRSPQLDGAGAAGLRSGAPLGEDPRDRLRLGWLKTFADGSLGSETAALLEPMASAPGAAPPPNGGLGVWLQSPEALREQAARAARLGIATQVHGIGDAAVAAALDALAPTVGATALVPRVEHAQLVADADIARFAALGIAASVQPVHLRSDVDKARRRWGDRADARAFPLAALDAAGALLAFGTDAPVEPLDPWPGLACAVTRAAPTWPAGTPPLGPRHALPLWRAIRAACVDPAITAGEADRGRLVTGHRADVVVLPAAAVAEPVEVGGALWHARPRVVLMDGEVVAGAV